MLEHIITALTAISILAFGMFTYSDSANANESVSENLREYKATIQTAQSTPFSIASSFDIANAAKLNLSDLEIRTQSQR